MTQPRRLSVFDDRPGLYHCVTRCVRQAFLCADDIPCTASHRERRGWIEQRILDLAASFAVGIYAWAAMSNHCHIVVLLDPLKPNTWSAEEVAERWCRISQFPGRPVPEAKQALRIKALLDDPERVAVIRERLGSLSWFMRFLNEGIARRANAEDGCKGHFWDGRFRSQNLLDDRAVLAAMAYVDLNPIRAGMAGRLEDCSFTSIQHRLRLLRRAKSAPQRQLRPLAGLSHPNFPAISTASYVRLVRITGRHRPSARPGSPSRRTVPSRTKAKRWWLRSAWQLERRFAGFVGHANSLADMARQLGKRWLRGERPAGGND